ncbi:hypothetical protein Dimus_000269 [Dionaea muscipula]
MESWEALDLDDSDLSSLLRPCKRRCQPISLTQFSNSPPLFQSLSFQKFPSEPPLAVTHDNSQSLDASTSLHPSPWALPSPSSSSSPPPPQQQKEAEPLLPQLSKSHHLIPGAAGAIQAAMHRRDGDRNDFSHMNAEISTQEYIRRVEEDQGEEFMHEPWLSAINFLEQEGMTKNTPLSEVKKCVDACKIDQVVAIIKSCSQNGFGDLMVMLKDPSDTIGASIHHKVLNEKEYRRDIAVGSVLILQKVAVFSPSRASWYVNVTLNNVVKVFKPVNGRLSG